MEWNKSRRRAAHMCVLKADFQNCRTQLAQGFFTSSKRGWVREWEERGLQWKFIARHACENSFRECVLWRGRVRACYAPAKCVNVRDSAALATFCCGVTRKFKRPPESMQCHLLAFSFCSLGEVEVALLLLLLGVWSTHSRKVNNCKV